MTQAKTARYSLIDPTGRLVWVGSVQTCMQLYHDHTYRNPNTNRKCWKVVKRDV